MSTEQSARSTAAPPGRCHGDREVENVVEDAEAARLAAVTQYGTVHTAQDKAINRIVALAARLLSTPMASVSLVDSDRIWFKATHGLGRLTHIELSPGLCSSAIQQNEPYVVFDALHDPRTAGNPLVHGEWGIRFYAAAPIITSNGHRLGTINVLDTRPREISDSALAMLRDLAAVVMDELELRLSTLATLRHERELREQLEGFASTLQRTLLPPSLPKVPGLELMCHYHTASPSEVTGDFYDVFALGDGRWAFSLGDVTGHGAPAATVTSLTRYTLRTAALHNPDPAAVLAELNGALLMEPSMRQCCTVLFGIAHPVPTGGFDITLAGGGHPPALWLKPEQSAVEAVWPDGGMLVGALPDATFATAHLRLQAGQTLLLYTDGLTEARPGGSFFGEEGLTAFLAQRTRHSATKLINELVELIESFKPAPTDDVALLALTVPAYPSTH